MAVTWGVQRRWLFLYESMELYAGVDAVVGVARTADEGTGHHLTVGRQDVSVTV